MLEEYLYRWVCIKMYKLEVRKEFFIEQKDNDIER